VETAATLARAATALHEELDVERVSIARLDHAGGTFEIVAGAGKALLMPGLDVPMQLSTQIEHAARTGIYTGADFGHDARWQRPVDRLMVGLGFSSGCSFPVGRESRPVGVVSLSSTSPGVAYDRRLQALAEVGDLLGRRLREHRDARPGPVVIHHDDDIVAEGLLHLLWRELGVDAERGAALSARDGVTDLPRPSLIICGTSVSERPVTEFLADLRATGADAPVVVVAERDTPHARRLAATSGAAGYVVLAHGARGIVDVLAAVRDGRPPPAPPPPVVRDPAPPRLTRRERDVLRDLDEGLRFKQIAARRGISHATVKSYARSLFAKLEAHSRTEAVNAARRQGLIDSC
jgi:DNA-binding NarL/FixJ family response regulator